VVVNVVVYSCGGCTYTPVAVGASFGSIVAELRFALLPTHASGFLCRCGGHGIRMSDAGADQSSA